MNVARVLVFAAVLGFGGCREQNLDHCVDPDVCDQVAAHYGIVQPPGAERQSRVIHVDGREMHLVQMEYGQAQDCPAGCSFDGLCALADPSTGSVDLVGFRTTAPVADWPASLSALCSISEATVPPFMSSPSTCGLTGYTPALLASPEVQPLLTDPRPFYLQYCSYFITSYSSHP